MSAEGGLSHDCNEKPNDLNLRGFTMTGDSPIVEEVRERRRILSERYGHDLQKYYEHLRELQSQYASRLVNQLTVIRSSGQKTK